jgi:hypothetical protein
MTAVLEDHDVSVRSGPPRRRNRPGWRLAMALVGLGALILGYLTNLEPLGDAGVDGVRGVGDAEVHAVRPPLGATTYLARYRPGDQLVVVFGLENTSALPVRLERIWTSDGLECGWAPTTRTLRTGPAYQSIDAPSVDADGYTLRPGEAVAVELKGPFNGDSSCRVGANVGINYVGIKTSILGIPRHHAYELPFEFGWTENPERELRMVLE